MDKKGPYVHYVTPEVWAAEIICDKGDPDSEYNQHQRLQLLHLDTRLNMDENKIVMDITTVQSNKLHVVHSVIPGRADSYFLKIPFPAVAKGVNKATSRLTVFDDPFFSLKMMRMNIVLSITLSPAFILI